MIRTKTLPNLYNCFLSSLISSDNFFPFFRLNVTELGVAAFLFSCGWYDLAFGKDHFFIYLFFQGAAFFIVGIGYVGTIVPQS